MLNSTIIFEPRGLIFCCQLLMGKKTLSKTRNTPPIKVKIELDLHVGEICHYVKFVSDPPNTTSSIALFLSCLHKTKLKLWLTQIISEPHAWGCSFDPVFKTRKLDHIGLNFRLKAHSDHVTWLAKARPFSLKVERNKLSCWLRCGKLIFGNTAHQQELEYYHAVYHSTPFLLLILMVPKYTPSNPCSAFYEQNTVF